MARRFPLYIDLTDRRVLVYGGGAVASRRVETLSRFGPAVTVVAPEIAPAIRSPAGGGVGGGRLPAGGHAGGGPGAGGHE